jgi:hypothetical protein
VPLILEVSGGSDWKQAAVMNPGDPEGSVSDNREDGRDILMFRCEAARSVIRRSTGGADFETGPGRVIVPFGFEELAVLADGESFERDVTTDRGVSFRVRWRHVGASAAGECCAGRRGGPMVEDGEPAAPREETVHCLLVDGGQAELVVDGAETAEAARWPAAAICEEAGLLPGELPGASFRVVVAEEAGRLAFSAFRLLSGGRPEGSRPAGAEVSAVVRLVHGAAALLELPGEDELARHPAAEIAGALGVSVADLPGMRVMVTVRESAGEGRALSGFKSLE